MHPEHPGSPEHDPDPYWHGEAGLGDVELAGARYPLRLRYHGARERYREHRELVPLEHATGERLYLHAQLYILVPDIRLTVAIPSPPVEVNGSRSPDRRLIGEVVSAEQTGFRPRMLGNAQGWCYPDDRLIVYWECILHDWCRQGDPLTDQLLDRIWTGVEEMLVERLPEADRIVTPSWEHLYPREIWQNFLRHRGYEPVNPAAYSKRLGTSSTAR